MKARCKITVLFLALALSAAWPALRAEEAGSPSKEMRKAGLEKRAPEDRIATIEKAVGALSDKQRENLKAAFARAEMQGEKLRRQPGDSKATMAKAREIQQTLVQQIRAALDPEQQKKFDAMLATAASGDDSSKR